MSILPTFYMVQVAYAPLPKRFLDALREIEVETSTERASVFHLRFDLSQTSLGDWDVLQFDLFRPMTPVRISVNLGKTPEVIVNGYVRSSELDNRSTPGESTLEVKGIDATSALMNSQEKSMPWPNMADSVIATTIFGQYAMLSVTFPTAASRTIPQTTTIQRKTDVRFLRDLAERNAFECYVQPAPFVGTDTGHFHPPQTAVPPQGVLSVNFGAATNLSGFHVSYEMLRPTSALAVLLDPTTKTIQPAPAVAATEPPLGREPVLTRVVPPPVVRPAGTQAANATELLATTRSIANRSSRCIRGSGQVDGLRYGRLLRPGLPALVRGAGREHSGLYYVTRVKHNISRDGHTQSFGAWRNAVGLTGAEVFLDLFAAIS
jgi:hypothetical protein